MYFYDGEFSLIVAKKRYPVLNDRFELVPRANYNGINPAFAEAKFFLTRDNQAVWGTDENNFYQALFEYLSVAEDIPEPFVELFINSLTK